ncbi:hypothetical protein E2562_026733 [Oryza meyeriana var. granulata]|uniref:Uncharacterized protein n=1 Tax=Oryza meyeriana var. granulata TaxID=110450 RepID=A0A6G1EZ59_9ORYZ|nr:hypothetical protein E2562_026733 [Oryza meyeriana var. granulata]
MDPVGRMWGKAMTGSVPFEREHERGRHEIGGVVAMVVASRRWETNLTNGNEPTCQPRDGAARLV